MFWAGRSDISGPERGAGHSTAYMKLIGVSSTHQILKFAYVFIHAVGWPASLYSPPKRCKQHQPKTGFVGSVLGKPPLIAGASTTDSILGLPHSARISKALSAPTLTAHSEPCPTSLRGGILQTRVK